MMMVRGVGQMIKARKLRQEGRRSRWNEHRRDKGRRRRGGGRRDESDLLFGRETRRSIKTVTKRILELPKGKHRKEQHRKEQNAIEEEEMRRRENKERRATTNERTREPRARLRAADEYRNGETRANSIVSSAPLSVVYIPKA
jgi:hypothetical protein